MINFYRKYVAEGKAIAVVAIISTLFLRGWLFVDLPSTANNFTTANGFLWDKLLGLVPLNNVNLIIVNYCLTIGLSLILAYISWHYSLVRDKTYLPFALTLIIFSSHPNFFLFSSSYLATILFFFALSKMFHLFQHPAPQWRLFQIGAIISVSSLFFIGILPYTILIFAGLIFFRLFNLKNILALLLGLVFVYWIALVVSFPLGMTQEFLRSFTELGNITYLPLIDFSISDWVVFGIFILLFLIVLASYKLTSHKDKIKTRSQIDFLFFISFLSFLTYSLLSWDLRFNQFIMLGAFIIPLSHFFALSYSKVKIVFFYVLLAAYLFLCIGQVYFF